MNGTCSVCGWWMKLCKCKEEQFRIQTTPDRLYNFVDFHTTGKPVVIHSKRQWKRHLKKLGMTDDIKQGNFKLDDGRPSKITGVPKEELKKAITEDLYGDKGFITKHRRG